MPESLYLGALFHTLKPPFVFIFLSLHFEEPFEPCAVQVLLIVKSFLMWILSHVRIMEFFSEGIFLRVMEYYPE
jgi:hypothetical protein